MITWLRRRGRLRGEAGVSVAELAVSAGLMVTVIAIAMTALTTDILAVGDAGKESDAVDELRLAFAQIERDVRSADCIFDPDAAAANPAQGAALNLYTFAGGSGAPVTWQADGSQRLVRVENAVSRVFAHDVATLTFKHWAPNQANLNEAQKSRVDMTVVLDTGARSGSTRQFQTTVTARNANVVPTGSPRKCSP